MANIPEEQTKVPIKLEINNDTNCKCGRPLQQNNEKKADPRCRFCTLFLENKQGNENEAKDEALPPKKNEIHKSMSLHLIRALDKERDAWINLSKGVKVEKLNRIQKLQVKNNHSNRNKIQNIHHIRRCRPSNKELNKRIFSLR